MDPAERDELLDALKVYTHLTTSTLSTATSNLLER
jgi:hypothetical protein